MCVRHENPCMLERECPPWSHIQQVQSTSLSFSNVCGFKGKNGIHGKPTSCLSLTYFSAIDEKLFSTKKKERAEK